MENLFDESAKTEILNRIDKLYSNAKAQWGWMNVNQGLHHMSMAFDISTGELNPTPAKVPGMPKWLFKFFLLNVKPPKEQAETFLERNTVANNINSTDFETERQNLKNKINKFTSSATLIPENKLDGKFTKTDWGRLNYNH